MRTRTRQRGSFSRSIAVGLRLAVLVLLAIAGAETAEGAAEQAVREYDVKAALLFNFTSFVDWPDRAFSRPDSPLVIGILGADPFAGTLDELVRNETRGGRPIVVTRFSHVYAIRDCHLLFINASERGNLSQITAVLRGRPILTVGDFEGFTTGGGMIRLLKDPVARVRLRINLAAIKAADLVVSAKLLRVAETVDSTKD